MLTIKPLRLGIMTKAIAEKPGGRLVMSGLLCFDLLAPDTLLSEQAMWDRITPALGEQGCLDAWTPKPHGEVLVWGDAAAPKGQPVTQMQVSIVVGDQIRKTIQVHGDRHWQPTLMSASASKPAPFVTMPLTHERAFGGQYYASNPVGAGHDAMRRLQDGERVCLPNLEHPGNPLLHPQQEPQPAALMPVSLNWPGFGPGGNYDDAWRKHRFPATPLDYNWRAFNVAPLDQQIPTYFDGAESLEISGMHPEHPQIQSRLPALRLRFFARRKNSSLLEETTAVLDSICLFPSALCGVLIYRSELRLPKGDDLQSMKAIMLACERAGEVRPHAHYEEIFQLRTGEDRGLYALSDYQLMPPFTDAVKLRLDTRREEVRQEKADMGVKKDAWFAAFAGASANLAFPDGYFEHSSVDTLPVMPTITDLDIELGNVDMAAVRNTALAIRQTLTAEADLALQAAALKIADLEIKSDILQNVRRTGDLSALSTLYSDSAAPADPAFDNMARTLNETAERIDADPNWSLAHASQALAEGVKLQAMPDANDYEANLPIADKVRIAQARAAEAQNTPITTTPDSPESRTQFAATLRQIAAGLTAKVTHDTPALPPDTSSDQQEQFLRSMGLGATPAQAVLDPGLLMQTLSQTLQKAPPDQAGTALLTALASLPGTTAIDWDSMKPGLDQALQSQPDLLQKIAQGLAQPPAPEALGAQIAAGMDFKLVEETISGMTDEALKASTTAQLEQVKTDLVKQLGAHSPEAVKDGKLDWSVFLTQMGIGDGPSLPPTSLPLTNTATPEEKSLERAKSLALGLPGLFRLGPELPPITPEEVTGRQITDDFLHNVDPIDRANTFATNTAYLQACQDATQKHGGLTKQALQDITDHITSHALAQPESDPVRDKVRMDKMQAMAEHGATLGHSIWREMASDFEQLHNSGRQRSLVSLISPSDITPAIALAVGSLVRQQAANGTSLAGRDLAGADLRGAQLAGLDLRGAFFEHADLSGADLSGAQCEGVVFAGACLNGATLRGAHLKHANFGQAQAINADFQGAQMDDAKLYKANFDGANLSHVQLGKCNALQTSFVATRFEHSSCDQGNFIKADLSQATLSGASWHKAVFIDAKLNDLLAHQANLSHCVFAEVEANNCDFSNAELLGVIAVDSSFKNLLAVGLKAEGSGWAKSDLTGSKFHHADLQQVGFMETKLDGAELTYANLHRAVLLNASLRGACLEGTQLFEASLRGADLSHASLCQANLHGADLSNAVLDCCDISGARRLHTHLEMPSDGPQD